MEAKEQTPEHDHNVTPEATEEQEAPQTAEDSNPATALEAERDEWKERALRLAADMENLRKRTQKDVDDAHKFAVSGFAKEMLGIADNLERAIKAVEEDKSAEEHLKAIHDGVKMIASELDKTFTKFGIEKIDAVGQKLDPDLHQVMSEVESPDHTPGTVVEQFQPGYTLKGRLLRPALVVTAKKTS